MYLASSEDPPWAGNPISDTSTYTNPAPQSSPSGNIRLRNPSQENTESGPPSKRRRAALACSSCRARKSRCDGLRPTCSMCQGLGFDCRYQQPASYPNVIIGKEYLSSIEERLKVVESRLLSLGTLTPPASAGPESSHRPGSVAEEHEYETEKAGSTVETACVTDDVGNSNGTDDSIDGMGAVSFAPEEDCAFFGPSSNIALLRDISHAVARISHTGTPWVPSPAARRPEAVEDVSQPIAVTSPPSSLRYSFSDPYNSNAGMTDDEKINIYALPPDSLARELIRRYFSNTGQLFPYIHEDTFIMKYNQMQRDDFRGVRRMWLGLLNVVFAMATSVSLSPDGQVAGAAKRTAESDIYYRRASGLCSEQIALGKGMSLDAVQYLLLMGQYLQGTQKSVQTWVTHGLAIKVAMQLGLHSSQAAKGCPPLEQEIWKRTWFACVTLDRTLSMTFGRPPIIPESHVKLSLPVPYDSPSAGPGVNNLEEMSLAFFNSTITLYRVMSSIIDLLYDHNLGCGITVSAVETVARVFKLENELLTWQRTSCKPSLINASNLSQAITEAEAPTLVTPRNEESGSIPSSWWPAYELRLRIVITLRYNNLQILLHRPVIASLLTRSEDDEINPGKVPIIRQIGSSSVQICNRSAKEIISIVFALVHSKGPARGLLGAWWFTLYYTFNAALVIVAGVLISIQENEDLSATIMNYNQHAGHSLRDAIGALYGLDSDQRTIVRCREYLEQLVQVLQSILTTKGQGLGFEFQLQGLPNGTQYPSQSGMDSTLVNGNSVYSNQSASTPKQSPLGIELGEFFMDRDLNFLNNHMFAFGQDGLNALLE